MLSTVEFITVSGARYTFKSTETEGVYALTRVGEPVPGYANKLKVRLLGSAYLSANNQLIIKYPDQLVEGYYGVFEVFGQAEMNTSLIETILYLN